VFPAGLLPAGQSYGEEGRGAIYTPCRVWGEGGSGGDSDGRVPLALRGAAIGTPTYCTEGERWVCVSDGLHG